MCVSVWHKWCAIVYSRAVVSLSHLGALNICCPSRAHQRSLCPGENAVQSSLPVSFCTVCNCVCFPHYPIWEPFVLLLVRLITMHSTDHTSCLVKFFCYIIVSAQEHQHVFLLTAVLAWFLCSLWNKVNSVSEGFTSLLWILSKGPSFWGGLHRELDGHDGCCKSPSPKRNTSVNPVASSF